MWAISSTQFSNSTIIIFPRPHGVGVGEASEPKLVDLRLRVLKVDFQKVHLLSELAERDGCDTTNWPILARKYQVFRLSLAESTLYNIFYYILSLSQSNQYQ
jgi:hypothetical protein